MALDSDTLLTLQTAVAHYDRHVLREAEERGPSGGRQELETAVAYLEAGQPLSDAERELVKRVVTSYIGHLSRGGYSGGPAPTQAEVKGAHALLAEIERPAIADLSDPAANTPTAESTVDIER
jgi:hypothetical protein